MTATEQQYFQIRPATTQDVVAISHVHINCWRTTYSGIIPKTHLDNLNLDAHIARHMRLITKPGNRYFVADFRSAGIVGFVSGGPERSGDTKYSGELYAINLLQDFQRQGVGSAMVRQWARQMLDDGLRNALVRVLSANTPAIAFYKQNGARFLREESLEIGGVCLPEQSLVFDAMTTLVDSQP